VRRQRLDDANAQRALEHMLCHLDGVDAQLAVLEHELAEIATREPWSDPVRWLRSFRGIGLRTALGLLAEIGDLRRFGSAREPMSFLGLVVSESSSGDRQHRGHLTKTGNRHARRLLIEAAWHYQRPPRRSARTAALSEHVPPAVSARARRRPRSACTTATATSPTTASAPPSRPPPSPVNLPADAYPVYSKPGRAAVRRVIWA
jgi:transposase